MFSLGWRNLRQDPVRALVCVLGVTFAVLLVTVEVGLLLGLARNASLLVDTSGADLIVSTVGVKNFDFATPLDRRTRYRIEAVPGVERVEEYNVSFGAWRLPAGGVANVQVVGMDVRGSLAAPLPLVAGRLADLHNQDAVIIDEGDRGRLGGVALGDWVEILNFRAKVVGFTRDMRSFSTMPYLFTSIRRAARYGFLSDASGRALSVYFLVKSKPGFGTEAVRKAIAANVSGVETHTREGLSWRTRRYWLVETGVGLGFLAGAFLGLLVGGVIVSQSLYAMTVDKLPEFGVLKALGAGMPDLARVVLEQSLICGALGFVLGLLCSWGAAYGAACAGTRVEIPSSLVLGIAALTAGLCSGASLVSIARLRRVEPALVFRA